MNSLKMVWFIVTILLCSCDSNSPIKQEKNFLHWINHYEYVEGNSFADSANRNTVPQDIIGHAKEMGKLLEQLGIQDCRIQMQYSVNMGVCYAFDLSGKYHLLLYGSPFGESDSQSLIRMAKIVRRVSDKELADGLREIFGMPPIIVPAH